jgi:lipopolysaccharide export system permease protein
VRTHRRLRVYVAQEFLLSFVIGFLFFFFIFFVNILLVMAEEIFSKNVPIREILLLVLYSIPQILALSFPFAALIGSLMAVGRLSSGQELLAMRASGVSLRIPLAVVVLLGLAFSVLSFAANDYLLPVSNLRMGRIYRRIVYSNPGIELAEYSIRKQEDMTIVTGRLEGTTFLDFTVLDKTEDGKRRIISARRARLREGEDRGVVSLELEQVLVQLRDAKDSGKFEFSTVDSMEYNVPLKNIQPSLQSPGPREMSSVDVWTAIVAKRAKLAERVAEWTTQRDRLAMTVRLEARYARELVADSLAGARRQVGLAQAALSALQAHVAKPIRDRTLENYEFEFHQKFALPFACTVFFLFAFPVGLLARKSGRAVGFGVGLLVSILYWGLLVGGQTIAPKLAVSPAVAAWIPDAVVLALGLIASLAGRGVES